VESVKHLINALNRQLQFAKSTNQETALDAEFQTCGFSLTVTFLVEGHGRRMRPNRHVQRGNFWKKSGNGGRKKMVGLKCTNLAKSGV
jgi:hypothetical protein